MSSTQTQAWRTMAENQRKEITLLRDAIEEERRDKVKLLNELEVYRGKLKRILRAVHRQRQARDGQGGQEALNGAPVPAAAGAGPASQAGGDEDAEGPPRRRQRVAGGSSLWNERDGGLAPRHETASGGSEAAGEQSQRYWGSSVVATQEANSPLRLPRRT